MCGQVCGVGQESETERDGGGIEWIRRQEGSGRKELGREKPDQIYHIKETVSI